jgi:hypothetical protein
VPVVSDYEWHHSSSPSAGCFKKQKKMMNAMSFFALLCIPFLAGHRIDHHGPEMGLLGST